jgi:hypothetical protein
MQRIFKNYIRVGEFHNFSGVHNKESIRHFGHHSKIMGDKKNGRPG